MSRSAVRVRSLALILQRPSCRRGKGVFLFDGGRETIDDWNADSTHSGQTCASSFDYLTSMAASAVTSGGEAVRQFPARAAASGTLRATANPTRPSSDR